MPRITIDQEKCIGAGKCARVCPKGHLVYGVVKVNGQKKCVVKDSKYCLGCTTCIGSCPTGAIKVDFSAPKTSR